MYKSEVWADAILGDVLPTLITCTLNASAPVLSRNLLTNAQSISVNTPPCTSSIQVRRLTQLRFASWHFEGMFSSYGTH